MGDRKPIGVAYRDQDIDGGEIGRNDPQVRAWYAGLCDRRAGLLFVRV
jgi:hypothetical protein